MKLGAIGIVSNNPEKSIEFYSLFNLKFTAESKDHYECKLSNGIRLMIDSEELMQKLQPGYIKPKSSMVTLCFEMKTAKDVDELCKQLKIHNYPLKKEPWDAFWGQRYATVLDPDGSQVDIFAQLTQNEDQT